MACSMPTSPIIDVAPEDSPLSRLWELCNRTFEYYIPYDPDDPSVRSQCRSEGVVLDELAVPLPIILARLAKGNVDARKWMFRMLLPDSLCVLSSFSMNISDLFQGSIHST